MLLLTYFRFLFLFVIIPSIILFNLLRNNKNKKNKSKIGGEYSEYYWIIFISLIAFFYTIYWDNYLVANKVWWYDVNLVANIIIGFVPLEEYCFFVLQPIFVGLYLKYIIQQKQENHDIKYLKPLNIKTKVIILFSIASIWLISLLYFIYFSKDFPKFKYLMLIIVWSFPPLIIQLLWGLNILFHYRKSIIFVIISSSIYLSLTDCIAIYYGIWTISEQNSIGNIVPNVLPFEEAFFFFITNVLCVFGCSFYLFPISRQEIQKYNIF